MPTSSPIKAPILYWLRRDLRLRDNPALTAALKAGPTIAVYILEDTTGADSQRSAIPGSAGKWWLHHSLLALQQDLQKLGVSLILRRGDPARVLPALVKDSGAAALHYSRLYDRRSRDRDASVERALPGIAITSHNSLLLHEPWELKTKGGTPFKVYTPFSRALFAAAQPKPSGLPKAQTAPRHALKTDTLESWQLLPTKPDWAGGFRKTWKVGEAAAQRRLAAFAKTIVGNYADGRNLPSDDFTSRLSPHLAFGELSPRQIWEAISQEHKLDANRATYLKELAWRDFAYHVLYHAPDLPDAALDKRYAKFPYRRDAKGLDAWYKGRTGYPIVDAGMRQLWQTGWMHNRVRLITASFLIKHQLLRWQDGADWFLDTLVDADIADNSMNWQWVAGCGPDAAPYFRIFNPVLQSRKFKAAAYIREFVPELARLPDRYVHAPWEAPPSALAQAGVTLGIGPGYTYPSPIVDHEAARARALLAFREMRAKTSAAQTSPATDTKPTQSGATSKAKPHRK